MRARRHGAYGHKINSLHSKMVEGMAYFARKRRKDADSHERWWRQGQHALWWDEPHEPIDKSDWGEGPWQGELDALRWTNHATGLECRIVRNNAGAFCGYVAIPESRAARRKRSRQGFRADDLEVHGGVTFNRQIGAKRWIGFDCSHYMDLSPAMEATLQKVGAPALIRGFADLYRDLQYVTAEVERLALQLAAWALPAGSGYAC